MYCETALLCVSARITVAGILCTEFRVVTKQPQNELSTRVDVQALRELHVVEHRHRPGQVRREVGRVLILHLG